MTESSALVVGPTGAVGTAVVDALHRKGGCRIFGVSRRTLSDGRWTHISADLLDREACHRALAGKEITHIFYAARAAFGEGGLESVSENRDMLANVVTAFSGEDTALRHVHLVEGGKWYGQHLGPYRTPAREDDPRHMPPNFYYDQEDWLSSEQRGKSWTWSASRPNVVCGFAPDRGRNLTSTLAVYGAICAELGIPLDFPGTAAGFETLTEITDEEQLGEALVWLGFGDRATNQAFNVSNGDAFRWNVIWPFLAETFGVKPGVPRNIRLDKWMADKGSLWKQIAKRHRLVQPDMDTLVNWSYLDFLFRQDWDVISDLGRLRRTGFSASVDSYEMFSTQIARYRDAALLPKVS